MDKLSKEYLIDFYSRNLMLHGDRPEALRWTPEGQIQRYEALLNIAPSINGQRVLDYGCGKGDLYSFMKARGIKCHYTGTDINPELISLAAKKNPECDFFVLDIEEEDLKETFDYIFVCGVFNNKVQGTTDSMKSSLSSLFRFTRKGLAVSLLTSVTPVTTSDVTYHDPGDVLNYLTRNITPYLKLYHAYAPDDMLFFLYKSREEMIASPA